MEAAGKRYIVHPSRSDVFRVYDIADAHLGTRACCESKLIADIESVRADTHSFWLGTGDTGEYITVTDKRFDPTVLAEWVEIKDLGKLGKHIAKHVRDTFRPIKHKCLGMCYGNHEASYMKYQDQMGLHSWLCTELGVPNMEYSALFDLVFVRNPRVKTPKMYLTLLSSMEGCTRTSFRFYIHHGAGWAVTPGGKLNRLIKFMNAFEADVYMIGHVHDQVGKRKITVGANANCTDIVARHKVGIISGSYLKTYMQGVTTYGERAGYEATALGAGFVTIKPETREVRGEI